MRYMWLVICLVLAAAAPAAAADDVPVARVNDTVLTVRDLEEAIDALIPRSTYHRSVKPEKRGEFRDQALDNLIVKELQYQDALTRELRPDKKQVKERFKRIRDKFASKQEFREALKQSGITEDQLMDKIRKEVLVDQVIARTVEEPARVSNAALKEYYEKNKDKFVQPESVRLRVISTKDAAKAKQAAAAVGSGQDFGVVAAATSEDMYRVKGGDIGYIHRGRVLPEIEKLAFGLKVGETGGPVKAGDLWYVVKVDERKPETQLTFDQVSGRLRKDLERKRSDELREQWIANLRAKAKIEIIPQQKAEEPAAGKGAPASPGAGAK